jgi:hypothetical protein
MWLHLNIILLFPDCFKQVVVTMWDFKFSRQRVWCSDLSSGIYCRVKLLSTDVSEVCAAPTSEMSVDNYFTWQYIPEDKSELHTRCRENLKSHIVIFRSGSVQVIFVFYWKIHTHIFYSKMSWQRSWWHDLFKNNENGLLWNVSLCT